VYLPPQLPFCCFYGNIPQPAVCCTMSEGEGMFLSSSHLLECSHFRKIKECGEHNSLFWQINCSGEGWVLFRNCIVLLSLLFSFTFKHILHIDLYRIVEIRKRAIQIYEVPTMHYTPFGTLILTFLREETVI
jgi:hypothetical protein